jgi:hypothetical protein
MGVRVLAKATFAIGLLGAIGSNWPSFAASPRALRISSPMFALEMAVKVSEEVRGY